MEASSSLGSSLGLTAKKEAMATPNLKAPELQECPFPVGFVPQKETAAAATAPAAPTQAGQQPRHCHSSPPPAPTAEAKAENPWLSQWVGPSYLTPQPLYAPYWWANKDVALTLEHPARSAESQKEKAGSNCHRSYCRCSHPSLFEGQIVSAKEQKPRVAPLIWHSMGGVTAIILLTSTQNQPPPHPVGIEI